MKFVKQRDKLTLHELRKFFHERRRRKDDLPFNENEEAEQVGQNKGMVEQQNSGGTDESNNMVRSTTIVSSNLFILVYKNF